MKKDKMKKKGAILEGGKDYVISFMCEGELKETWKKARTRGRAIEEKGLQKERMRISLRTS